jgi:hypothetical protein
MEIRALPGKRSIARGQTAASPYASPGTGIESGPRTANAPFRHPHEALPCDDI